MTSYVLPVDKPVGPTSHDIVSIARRALGTKRIGHTGTLDPFASGLLLLCVNNATRIAEYLTNLRKTYHAVARLDGMTTTDDCTGDFITTSAAWDNLYEEEIRAAFAKQVGTIMQLPSAFSAKKVKGERAYEIARRGETPDLAANEVTIYDIRILRIALPEVEFAVDCSSGTYVRSIARDVGALLGTGGYLNTLRRTAIGAYSVENAVAPEMIAEGPRIPVLDALTMPRVDVDEVEERALRFGQSIEHEAEQGTVAIAHGDRFIAIAESDGIRIKPKKVFSVD
jgi:tRNA pseudouridine55 synthase